MTTQTTQTSGWQPTGQCPVDHGALAQRKMPFANEAAAAPVERDANGVWHVRNYDVAKRVLRSSQTRQAGFGADMVRNLPDAFVSKEPVLYQDGQAHREQRGAIARYFTPKATRDNYHELMEHLANEMIATLHREDRVELSDLSLHMATAVAAQVVGLTNSLLPGMEGRINRFITGNAERGISEAGQETARTPRSLFNFARNQINMGSFLYLDVKPAIRARKRQRQDDVISHLIDQEYNDAEILIECVTYGTAGMVTTREFIVIAAWHLIGDAELCAQYLAADEAARHQILEEILRVEPIVGNLYRRATEDIEVDVEVEGNGEPLTIPAGDLIDLHIYAVNADPSVVGEQPTAVCPLRELDKRAQPSVMAFGDGAHRCPGAYIAIQESDIFLHKLLSIQGLRLVSEPRIEYKELVKGYEVRNFILAVDDEAKNRKIKI